MPYSIPRDSQKPTVTAGGLWSWALVVGLLVLVQTPHITIFDARANAPRLESERRPIDVQQRERLRAQGYADG